MFLCFPGNHRSPPNLKSREIVRYFKIITIAELIFGLVGILIGNILGLFCCMKAMIIYCSYHALDPCYCVIYECFTLEVIYINFSSLGLIIQNDKPIYSGNSIVDQSNLFYLINLIFSLVVLYPVFSGYREFKGIQFDRANGRLSDGGFSLEHSSIDYEMNSVNNIQDGEDREQQQQPAINNNILNVNNNLRNEGDVNNSSFIPSRQNIVVHDLNEEEEEKKEDFENILNNHNTNQNPITVKDENGVSISRSLNNRDTNKIERNFLNEDKNKNPLAGERENINNINRSNNEPFQPFKGKGVLVGASN